MGGLVDYKNGYFWYVSGWLACNTFLARIYNFYKAYCSNIISFLLKTVLSQ